MYVKCSPTKPYRTVSVYCTYMFIKCQNLNRGGIHRAFYNLNETPVTVPTVPSNGNFDKALVYFFLYNSPLKNINGTVLSCEIRIA